MSALCAQPRPPRRGTPKQADADCGSRPRSSTHTARHVPELLRIAHDIDRADAIMRDVQRGGLENAAALDRDEPRRAVDEAVAHEARPARRIDRRERNEQPHDVIEPDGRRLSGRRRRRRG